MFCLVIKYQLKKCSDWHFYSSDVILLIQSAGSPFLVLPHEVASFLLLISKFAVIVKPHQSSHLNAIFMFLAQSMWVFTRFCPRHGHGLSILWLPLPWTPCVSLCTFRNLLSLSRKKKKNILLHLATCTNIIPKQISLLHHLLNCWQQWYN